MNDTGIAEPLISPQRYAELLADLMEAREALKFYASKNNWGEPGPDQRDWYLIESTDRGDKARKALSKLDEKYPVKDEA